MKLMVFILNRTERLEMLLEGFSNAGVGGATIIDSAGLAQTLNSLDSSLLTSTVRELLGSSGSDGNKTILSAIRDDQLETVRKVIYAAVGDLSLPNTGILLTIPIDFAEGLPIPNQPKENK
ncbi:MAG: hypothetical protein LIO41_00375 [Ruminococcus sp.]|nr:hypothetical protein [Ruminococcus sp.]